MSTKSIDSSSPRKAFDGFDAYIREVKSHEVGEMQYEANEEKGTVLNGLIGRVSVQAPSVDAGESCSDEDWEGCYSQSPSPAKASMRNVFISPSPAYSPTSESPLVGFYKELTGELDIQAVDAFFDVYLELGKTETPEAEALISEMFFKLDDDTQEFIQAFIEEVLTKEFPNLSDEEMDLTIEKVCRNPFITIKNPEGSKERVSIMYLACFKAKLHEAGQVARRAKRSLTKHNRSFEGAQQVAKVLFFQNDKKV